MRSCGWISNSTLRQNVIFIYFKIHLACINVYNQYFKNLLYCQPETTKRVVSCFSQLLNLVNKQLSILEFKYNFNLHIINKYIHAQLVAGGFHHTLRQNEIGLCVYMNNKIKLIILLKLMTINSNDSC